MGSAMFSLSANFNKTKFTRLEVPAVLAAAGLSLIDRARQGDFTDGTPRDKFVGNVLWTRGDVSLNLRATRYGKVTMVAATRAADGIFHDDTVDPKVLFDIEAGYKITPAIKISAGANNLFNIYPTVLDPVNQGAARFAYYNTYAPYGISGGYYYGKLSFTL
jgi:iron complex outermembrane receptor protein